METQLKRRKDEDEWEEGMKNMSTRAHSSWEEGRKDIDNITQYQKKRGPSSNQASPL